MDHPKKKGFRSEVAIMNKFVQLGEQILVEFVGDNLPYDFLWAVDHKTFVKVQCKTLSKNVNKFGEYLRSTTCRCRINTKKSYKKAYTKEEVDLFALYYPEKEKIYLVLFDNTPKANIRFREDSYFPNEATAKSAENKIRWARNYELTFELLVETKSYFLNNSSKFTSVP